MGFSNGIQIQNKKKTPYIFDKIYEGKTWQKSIYQYDIISIYCNGKFTKKNICIFKFYF